MALKQTLAAIVVTVLALAAHAAGDEMAPLKALAQREAAGGSAGARAMVSLLDGRDDRDTVAQAMAWLQKAADSGKHEAQFQLAFQYETAPVPDYRRAFEWYSKAAAQGNLMARSNLASMALFGRGMKRDPLLAIELALLSAEKGNAVSQALLGAIYAGGDGVPVDSLKAEYWLEKAAVQDYADAQVHLGSMFLLGESGVERNNAKGLYWLKRAAAHGNARARALLAKAVQEKVPGASDPLPDKPPQ